MGFVNYIIALAAVCASVDVIDRLRRRSTGTSAALLSFPFIGLCRMVVCLYIFGFFQIFIRSELKKNRFLFLPKKLLSSCYSRLFFCSRKKQKQIVIARFNCKNQDINDHNFVFETHVVL